MQMQVSKSSFRHAFLTEELLCNVSLELFIKIDFRNENNNLISFTRYIMQHRFCYVLQYRG